MSVAPAPCPSAEILEGIAAGQVQSTELREHVEACVACRQAVERMREDNRFLFGFAVDGALPFPPPESAQQTRIPGYEIVREIHRGGQGIVYEAVQRSTKRPVAIKLMKQGAFATLADRARFDREVEMLSGLNHPNIVAVHDAGMTSGFQYFVMDYVEGRSLDEAFAGLGSRIGDAQDGLHTQDQASGAALNAALETFIKVCDAVHAAHLRGVIHRDLKPSNIRVDPAGEPHVLDFGLAKSTTNEPDATITRTGQFVGSLPWASPEQVEGASAKLDLRTDVYSLGTMLFQLLTGGLPFDVDSNLRDAVHDILYREPPRPSAIAAAEGGPRGNDELDTIVLKCLAKDRERRYQTAGELARDLRRYVDGEAIEAKRDSALYVLRKTLRRYRWRVAAAGAFVGLLGVFSIVMAVLYRQSARLEREALRSAVSLGDSLAQSNIEQGRMAGLLGNMEQAEKLLWGEMLTQRQPRKGADLQLRFPPGSREAYWGLWELYRRYPCLTTLTSDPAMVRTLTVADDGESIWTVDKTGLVQKLDTAGAVQDSYRVVLPDAHGLAVVDARGEWIYNFDGKLCPVWHRGAGVDPVFRLPPEADATIEHVFLSHTSRLIAGIIEGAAVVWTTDPFAEVARFADVELTAVAISNDEQRLAGRDLNGSLHLWDITTQRRLTGPSERQQLPDTGRQFGELRFSPDDRWIGDAWLRLPGRIWDLAADPPTAIELSERPGDYRLQTFSPDGRLLAIGDLGGTLRMFDVRTGERLAAFVVHAGRVRCIEFARDGNSIWTGGTGDLRRWEAAADAGVRTVQFEGESLHCAIFSPDGRNFLTGGLHGDVHRVDCATLSRSSLEFGNDSTISCVAGSRDGHYLAVATYGNAVHFWDAAHPESAPVQLAHPSRVSHVCFSSDAGLIASSCDDNRVRVWRRADAQLVHDFPTGDRIPQITFDPDGSVVAAVVRDGTLVTWNLATGEGTEWARPTHKPLRAVRFSPDGNRMFVGGAERVIGVWDVAARQRLAGLVGHNQEIFCIDVSPDGEVIASGDTGGTIILWDANALRPLATLSGHSEAVMSVQFSPDNRALVSAALDGSVRLWDLSYYGRHIAGNLEAHLQSLRGLETTPAAFAAWRGWGEALLSPTRPQD